MTMKKYTHPDIVERDSPTKIAEQVAAEAVQVARDVAQRATETAAKVAEIAQKTNEAILIFGKDMEYLKKDVAEIKIKLDEKYTTIEEHLEVVNIQKDHESRVRLLEGFRDTPMGKMLAMGSLSGLVVGALLLVISHFWK